MALGIVTRSSRRGKPGRATTIDGMPVNIAPGKNYFVDGDLVTGGSGLSWETAFNTISSALTQAVNDIVVPYVAPMIYVKARKVPAGDADPISYAENVVIPATLPGLRLLGVGYGPAQGNLPQLKVGATTTQALLIVRSAGVTIDSIGFNGAGATGGGIRIESAATGKDAFGAVVQNCHFKNCKGTTATNAATGGAVQLSGAPWQILIRWNKFYKNVGGIVLLDTVNSVPQDVAIVENSFAGAAANVDCDIYLAGGSGPGVGLVIRGNDFNVFPAVGSGSVLRWMDLTGADGGVVAGNYFADDKTFGAAGTGALVPTTVFLSGNYDEGGLIARV